ncbi:MAG: hypothetical protein WCL37_03125 [Chrysiogenales bacterium]
MNNNHFSDEQIQEILDNMAFGADQSLAPHLNICASCRERFEQYQQLYAGLAVDPGFTLPPTFADSVFTRIPATRPDFWTRPAVRISLAVSACALVLAGLIIFVNMKPLADHATRIANSLATAFRPLSAQFQQMLAKLNGYAGLFMLGGLGLLSAAFFDHILQRQILRRSR